MHDSLPRDSLPNSDIDRSHGYLMTPYRLFARVILLGLFTTGLVGNASAKEAAAPIIPANNAVKLRAHVGKVAAVEGKVASTTVSKSGHHFIKFVSSNLTAVCFKENVGKFPAGGPAKLLKGKDIAVVGKIELYKNKPQIKLLGPDQIRKKAADSGGGSSKTPSLADVRVDGKKPSLADVRVDGKASGSKTPKFELKQVGKTTWISPAGLTYKGKDAEGLTRVEHVLRHAADQPRRAGMHGVFDGGNDKALAVVDEAWRLAKKKKMKPKNEGYTSTYTIPMGRRVGYLGGQVGGKRGKPALKKVFIVVRSNTSEVITAFPR